MPLLIVSKELQEKAEKELNEIPSKIQENINHIREWLGKQSHLNARTDELTLINFLRVNEYDIEKTKGRIELFYTCKTFAPEFFSSRDPSLSQMQEVLNRRIITVLPETVGPAGPRLIFLRAGPADPEKTPVMNFTKCMFMVLDVLFLEDPNFAIAGISLIVDLKDMSYRYVTQITPSSMKKTITCLLSAYPLKLKAVYFINTPFFFRAIYNVIKIFLDEKLKEKVHFYSKLDDCYNDIPRWVFSKDYGGEQPPCDEISDELKLKVENYRDWFLNDEQFCSNESKRPIKPKTSKCVFG